MIVRTAKKDARAARKAVAVVSLGLASFLVATGVGCSCGSSDTENRAGTPGASTTSMFTPSRAAPTSTTFKPGRLLRTEGVVVGPVAFDASYLVWETGAVEEAGEVSKVFQRDRRTGRTTMLAEDVNSSYGLASTSRWVVYVAGPDGRTAIAVHHDRAQDHVLSETITAPLASRGELVAWAEDDGSQQRVIVRHMGREKQWIAAEVPRCRGGRCFRIDAVALANRGVVFSRGAIGPHPSLVVRRAFAAARASQVPVVNDPQPDLVPSSSGALYYAFARGWYRWDFGEARPRRVRFMGVPPATVLGHERGRSLLGTNRRCLNSAMADTRARRRVVVASPELMRASLSGGRGTCSFLTAFAWAGTQPLTAWGLVPASEEEEEEEEEDEEERGGRGGEEEEEEVVGVLIAGEAIP